MSRPDWSDSREQSTTPFTRRTAIRGVGAGVAATLATKFGSRDRRSSSAQSNSTPTTNQSRTVDYLLVAEEFDWELMPGVSVRAWGYNGQMPGPEIRAREGDLLRVNLRNNLSVPTTIHWHGIHLRPEMDGPAGLNQAAVNPGEEFTYEFVATPGGTRWYHSHADPQLQVPMGLYGPLIIEPLEAPRPYAYDREYTLVIGEWDMELTPDVAAGRTMRGPGDQMLRGGELGTDMFLVNGHAHGAIPPIVISEGDRVLLRMINAGHLAHPIHMHGHSFKIVATDGNPVPMGMEWTKDTVLIGPSERYDLEFTGNNPGVWMFHCHIEHHMANGMMTVIQYEGEVPTGPAGEFFALATGDVTDHASHQTVTPIPSPSPTIPNTQAAAAGVVIAMVDDRFDPDNLTVARGTTVTWSNQGADWHSIASYDGSFESGKISPGESFAHLFDQPGTYQYICKHHGLHGMLGQIIVNGK